MRCGDETRRDELRRSRRVATRDVSRAARRESHAAAAAERAVARDTVLHITLLILSKDSIALSNAVYKLLEHFCTALHAMSADAI